ncbi:MAG: hypothetical protein Q7S88_02295 [Candidatus Daviesbacteria bacterium]|nr:hypothetical protein [Candidatus Daviesbacteria bacterium]
MKFLYQDSNLLENEIVETIETLKPYLDHLQKVAEDKKYIFDESSLNLAFDDQILSSIQELVGEKVTPKLKYIIDIGIGGSNLGTKAVYDALYGYADVLEPNRYPKILFADTNDPEFLGKLISRLFSQFKDPDEVLINAISKSGGTTETIVNLEVVIQNLKSKFPNILERLVITTDEGSKLWVKAKELGVEVLPIPKLVGGRFSVFSSVGLFPLLSAGLDVEALRNGALASQGECLQGGIGNPALVSAVILYLQSKNGKAINDNFFFHPELESLGKWYRQLQGESIGKVNTGITPTVSIGSTDLHSMAQLYLGGPKDKLTTFVASFKSAEVLIPQDLIFPLVEGIAGKSTETVMRAIYEGTKEAYRKNNLPFMEVILDDLSEKSLGEYLQFKMMEMMFLGHLLNVNTFDQPAVEDYKQFTKVILNKGS